jgi:hypothetical protein
MEGVTGRSYKILKYLSAFYTKMLVITPLGICTSCEITLLLLLLLWFLGRKYNTLSAKSRIID